jgi:hypothetical protein
MRKNWIAAIILLSLVAGLLGWQLYLSVKRFDAENDPAAILPVQDVKQRIGGEGELPALGQPQRYSPVEFEVIPSQDLFSATRGVEEEEETAVVEAAPVLQTKPVLVGVTLWGRERLAIINDPQSAGKGRRTKIMRVGDIFEGYTVTDISTNRMVLEYGNHREIIPLYDPAKHSSQQGKTPIIATRVVAFGSSGSSSGARQNVAANARSVTSGQPVVSPSRQTNTRNRSTATAAAQQAAERSQRYNRSRATDSEANPQSAKPANELRDAQGRRIIRTPFGDVVRPEPKKKPPQP